MKASVGCTQSVVFLACCLLLAGSVSADTSCANLNVGFDIDSSNVVRRGRVQEEFALGAPASNANSIGSDVDRTYLYFRNADADSEDSSRRLPVTVDLQYTSPFGETLLEPKLDGELAATHTSASGHLLGGKPKSASLEYNCRHAGGVSTVILNINCGGGSKAQPDLQVVWTKHCPHRQRPRHGIDLRHGKELAVSNGLALSDYQLGKGMARVGTSTAKSTFSIFTVDGTTQVFGPPRLEHDETELLASVSGDGHWGGVAAGAPTTFDVEYSCSKHNFVPSAYLTVVIDLCSPGTDPKLCDAQHHNSEYAPLRLEYVKFCQQGYSRSTKLLFAAVFILVVFCCLYVGSAPSAPPRPKFAPLTGDGTHLDTSNESSASTDKALDLEGAGSTRKAAVEAVNSVVHGLHRGQAALTSFVQASFRSLKKVQAGTGEAKYSHAAVVPASPSAKIDIFRNDDEEENMEDDETSDEEENGNSNDADDDGVNADEVEALRESARPPASSLLSSNMRSYGSTGDQ